MHAISKFTNIIMHGYNVCELKHREEWLTVNGKYKKSKFTYSVVPLFHYSLFRVLQAPVFYRGVEAYILALRCNNTMPVAVWVQIYPLLRLLLWLPIMWAQKS